MYSQLDYEAALHHVSESQLRGVAGRGLDKKVYLFELYISWLNTRYMQRIVRAEALNSVGKLFSLAYPEMYVLSSSRTTEICLRRSSAETTTNWPSTNLLGFQMKFCKLQQQVLKSGELEILPTTTLH